MRRAQRALWMGMVARMHMHMQSDVYVRHVCILAFWPLASLLY